VVLLLYPQRNMMTSDGSMELGQACHGGRPESLVHVCGGDLHHDDVPGCCVPTPELEPRPMWLPSLPTLQRCYLAASPRWASSWWEASTIHGRRDSLDGAAE
jgi:hypothetical protein